MSYPFDPNQLAEIQTRLTDAENGNGSYAAIYQYILDEISDENGDPAAGVDKSVWLWIEGAIKVNSNDGSFFSDFIRDYTSVQYELRYGEAFDLNKLQDASNRIAEAVAQDILDNRSLPSLRQIGLEDAGAIASEVFNQHPIDGEGNYAPWVGTILFPFLGNGAIGNETINDSFTSQWLLTTDADANKKLDGTYDLISTAAVSHEITNLLTSWWNSDELQETVNDNTIGEEATLSLLASLREKANKFFQDYYELPNIAEFQIGGDLPLYTVGVSGGDYAVHPNFILGTLEDDSEILTANTSQGVLWYNTDIVHAGLGDDVIIGSRGDDLIDGGQGTDMLDYASSFDVEVTLEGINGSFYQSRLIVENSIPNLDFKDYAYGIEILKLGNGDHDDTVTFNQDSGLVELYTGGGDDTVDTFNVTQDELKVDLGAGDDVFEGSGNLRVIGGAGDDTISGSVLVDYSADGSNSEITLNLDTGVVIDGFGDTDTLIDVAEVRGSMFTDTYEVNGEYWWGNGGYEGLTNFTTSAGDDVIKYLWPNSDNSDNTAALAIHTYIFNGGTDTFVGSDDVHGVINLPSGIVLSDLSIDAINPVPIVTVTPEDVASSASLVAIERYQYDLQFGIADLGSIVLESQDIIKQLEIYYPGNGAPNQLTGNFGFEKNFQGGNYLKFSSFATNGEENLFWALPTAEGGFDNKEISEWEFTLFDTRVTNEIRGSELVDEFDLTARTLGSSIYVYGGTDNVTGSNFVDDVHLGSGDDIANGLGGNDVIQGGRGNDSIYGGDGADRLYGESGDDELFGGSGSDLLVTGSGSDKIDGGQGVDTADFSGAAGGILVDANSAIVEYYDGSKRSFQNVERIIGTALNDRLIADYDINYIWAGGGSDLIIGESGDDTLRGGEGGDTISGGAGSDSIFGELGNDILVYKFAGNEQSSDAYHGGVDIDTLRLEELNASNYSQTKRIDIQKEISLFAQFVKAYQDGEQNWNGSYSFVNFDLDVSEIENFEWEGSQNTSAADDTYTGSNTNEVVLSSAGSDTVFARGGDDVLRFALAENVGVTNYYSGGKGSDTLILELTPDEFVTHAFDIFGYRSSLENTANASQVGGAEYAFGFGLTVADIEDIDWIVQNSINDQDNIIIGTKGDDNFDGLAGNDLIFGADGADTLLGGEGDDTLIGGYGDDIIDGGNGIDEVSYFDGEERVEVNLSLGIGGSASAGTDTYLNIENVHGSSFNDHLIGNDQANALFGDIGNDVLRGGGGVDVLNGGAGFDVVNYSDAAAGITAQLYNSVVTKDGDGGHDSFVSIEGIVGSEFKDTIISSDGDDLILGGGGFDVLITRDGTNTVYGGEGNDQFNEGLGRAATNYFYGDEGNDIFFLRFDAVQTTIDGGDGKDTISFSKANSGITIDLTSGVIDRNGDGNADVTYTSIEDLTGSYFDDVLIGNDEKNSIRGLDGNDIIRGGIFGDSLNGDNGNDVLFGGDNADTLSGGNGDDVLDGENGWDFLYGNAGSDTFVFSGFDTQANVDQIQDFALLDGDKVDASALLTAYDPALHNINDFARITIDGNDTIVEIDADGGGDNYVAVARLVNTIGVFIGTDPSDIIVDIPPNAAPVPANDDFTGDRDQAVTGNLLVDNGNGADSDPDNDPLSVVAQTITSAQGGTATLLANGDFTYTPLLGFIGNDSFDYVVVDDSGATATGSVNLTLNALATDSVGSSGDDNITGAGGSETIISGDGDDTIDGKSGADTIFGGEGSDTIIGGNGNDVIYGGTDQDDLNGGNNTDILFGDEGDDILFGGNGDDDIHGGDDNDTLDGGNGSDTLYGDSGDDIIFGDNGDDKIHGGTGNDTLDGGNNHDVIYGDAGDDIITGGNGNDFLIGGVGSDILVGNYGADTFVFKSADVSTGIDTIRGFTIGGGDRMDIADLLTGFDSSSDIITDFLHITDDGTDSFVAVDSDGGGDNFLTIAELENVQNLYKGTDLSQYDYLII